MTEFILETNAHAAHCTSIKAALDMCHCVKFRGASMTLKTPAVWQFIDFENSQDHCIYLVSPSLAQALH